MVARSSHLNKIGMSCHDKTCHYQLDMFHTHFSTSIPSGSSSPLMAPRSSSRHLLLTSSPEKEGLELPELLLLSLFRSSRSRESSLGLSGFFVSSGTNFFQVLMRDLATVIISSSLLLFLRLFTVIPILIIKDLVLSFKIKSWLRSKQRPNCLHRKQNTR